MNDHSSFKFIKKYFLPFKRQIIQTIISLLFTSIAILALGKFLQYIIDQGFDNKNLALFSSSFLFLITLIGIISVAGYVRYFLLNSICQRAIANIRKDIYQKLINRDLSYYQSNKVSDIVTNIVNDLSIIIELIGTNFPFAIRYILTTIGGIILLLIGNVKLTIYILIACLITILPIIMLSRYASRYSKSSQSSLSLIASHINSTLSNVKTVKLFQNEKYETEKFNNLAKINLENNSERIKYKAIMIAVVLFLIFTSISFILLIGVKEVISGKMRAGELSSFIYYAIIVAGGISGLGEINSDFIRLKNLIQGVSNLLKEKKLIIQGDVKFDKIENIKFESINFNYDDTKKILDNMNFVINKGDKIAIIGPSGAGKTTIFNLILGFYQTKEGSVKINDIDINRIDLQTIRNNIAFVTQEAVIFSGSIYDNIKYGKIDASADEVKQAAAFAGIDEDLNKQIGESNLALSGGQIQRIAIARAFLKNSDILLLDEPTNNLDKNIEDQIFKSYKKLTEGKTALIITHNPSLLKWVDKILVIIDGKIEAFDNSQLVVNSSRYLADFSKNHMDDNSSKIDPLLFN